MFNPSRFALARKRRGMTKRELADCIGITERSVSAYEKGEQEPERRTLQKIAEALRFPEPFFYGTDIDELAPDAASFRALTKMTARQRNSALGAGSIALLLNEWIEARFTLPKPDIPNLGRESGKIGKPDTINEEQIDFPESGSEHDPEAAAESLRSYWGLGELPIKNMIVLLESKGIRVFSLAIDAKEVDAFSMWYGGKPFIFLNTFKSAEHCRFDAAHELGHLVLHQHGQAQGPELEREANAFASAFLMPRRSVLANAPKTPTLKSLIAFKKYWTVSVAALNYRLHTLKLTTDWVYRSLCIQIAEAGYRTSEPESAQHETSLVLQKVFSALREEGVTKAAVAKQLLIDPEEINELTFGLMLNVLQGKGTTGTQPSKTPAKLHIVK